MVNYKLTEARIKKGLVDPDKQFYYCFGCHAGGNVIHFIMNAEKLTFPEAVQFLAERAGITVQTLCLIERGKYNPSLKVCTALCRALGRTLDDIFWESEDGESED